MTTDKKDALFSSGEFIFLSYQIIFTIKNKLCHHMNSIWSRNGDFKFFICGITIPLYSTAFSLFLFSYFFVVRF